MHLKNHLICLIFIAFTIQSCKKEKQGIEALPAATQEGKNTFGCLINGNVYVPKKKGLNPGLSVYYTKGDQGIFQISAPRQENNSTYGFMLELHVAEILENNTYKFGTRGTNNLVFGTHSIFINLMQKRYESSTNAQGELFISKIEKSVISGTFWFNATSETGEEIEIREGRFDLEI